MAIHLLLSIGSIGVLVAPDKRIYSLLGVLKTPLIKNLSVGKFKMIRANKLNKQKYNLPDDIAGQSSVIINA
mgnify:CR=1 FL=1